MRTVKIRSWESMADEFGLNESGDIKVIDTFVTYMKKYCGKTINLNADLRYESWTFSEQMFEPEERKLTNHAANIQAIDEIIKSYGKVIASGEVRPFSHKNCAFCALYIEEHCSGCPHFEINDKNCNIVKPENYAARIVELQGWRKRYVEDMDKELGSKTHTDLSIGSEVIVFDRYRFAIPLPGKVASFSTSNDGVEVTLSKSNSISYPVGCSVWVHADQLQLGGEK